MPRPRTGSADPHGDHFDIRIRLPDGTRSPRKCLPAGITREQAKAKAEALQKLSDEEHAKACAATAAPIITLENTGSATQDELVEVWIERWFEHRETAGLSSVEADRPRWKK